MMPGEFLMDPFERSIKGLRGTVLLRRNHDHAKRCADAIRWRPQPAWSSQHRDSLRVTPATPMLKAVA
jgi:hypothetical protein